MNVTLCSAFRNAVAYLPRYFAQVGELRAALEARGDKLVLIVGEGDSRDDSCARLYAMLVEGQYEATVLDVTHEGPVFSSIEHPVRFKQLAYVYNEIWCAIPPSADVALLVGSDLIWQAQTLLKLIDHIQDYVAVAPMVMDGPQSFYDVWAFRMDGQRFTKEPPYLPRKTRPDLIRGNLMQLDSAGGVLVMDGDLARKVRFSDDEEIVGLCRDIYAHGGTIWLDPTLKVVHP